MVWVRVLFLFCFFNFYSSGLCILSTFNVKQIQVKFPKQYKIEVFNLKILYTRACIYKMYNMYKRKSCINYKYSTGKSSRTKQIV